MDDEARARFGGLRGSAYVGALTRDAYLLTGDQHPADDLLQSALTKTAARWRTLRHEDPSIAC